MWFTANVLYESIHNGSSDNASIWEERIFLIRADSEEMAREKASTLAKNEEVSYTTASGDKVKWAFRSVENVFALDANEIQDGVEVFSRHMTSEEVESLRTAIK